MKSIILAAGFATRWFPLTENKSKGLLNYQGKPVMTHIVEEIRKVPQIDDIVIATNKRFFDDYIRWRSTIRGDDKIYIVTNDAMTNESRKGAVTDLFGAISTMCYNDEDLFITASDYLFTGLKDMYEEFTKEGKSLVSVLGPVENGQTRINGMGQIIEFKEKQKISKINSNPIYMIKADDLYRNKELNVAFSIFDFEQKDCPGHFIQFLVENEKEMYIHPELKIVNLEKKVNELS